MQLNQNSREDKTTRTLMFRNSNESTTNINYINSTLSAKTDANINNNLGNFNFEIRDNINVAANLDTESFLVNKNLVTQDNEIPNYLNYLNSNKADITNLTRLNDFTLRESDAVRGTTDAGTAVIAVGATAAIILTEGAAAAGQERQLRQAQLPVELLLRAGAEW